MYVFAYGSLLDVQSMTATLPDVSVAQCVPAVLAGHVRTFDVAFPNDGSQADKAYFDDVGDRPPVVLFANARPDPQHGLNGVLIPVSEPQLAQLRRRELRYRVSDVTDAVRTLDRGVPERREVVAFVGRPEFTDSSSVARGVVARDYLATITAGVAQWDARRPGFRAQFEASTRRPSSARIVALRRVDSAR